MTLFSRAAALALALTPSLALAETAPVVTFAGGKADPAQIEIPAGQDVTLTVKNAGKVAIEFESHALHVEKIVAPGAELKLPLKLPAGSYPFVDDFHSATKGVILAK